MKNTLKQMTKFYIVGGSGTVINLGIVYLLTDFLGIWYLLSASVGVIVSVTTNFFGNKAWTFKIKGKMLKLYSGFWASSILGIAVQLSLTYILVQYFSVWYMTATFVSIVLASLCNFTFSKFWVFKA
jgi:dolichol-phosphate mannosyltransferase